MKNKIDRKELYEQLLKVSRAVSTNEVIEQSDCFVFLGDGKVYSFNDEIAVVCKTKVKMKGAIKATELLNFINKLSSDTVEVKQKKSEIIFKSKGTTAGFSFVKNISLPIEDLQIPKKWKALPNNFCEAVKLCSYSCAKTMNRASLYCVCLRDKYAYGTDGFQATRYNFGEEKFEKELLIPFFAAKEVHEYDVKTYGESKGFLYFKTGDGLIFCTRTLKAKYPKLDDIVEFKGKKVNFPKSIFAALERANVFITKGVESDSLVRVHLSNGKCKIRSRSENGWSRDKIKIKYRGNDMSFLMNPRMLKNALMKTEKAVIGKKLIRFSTRDFYYTILMIKKGQNTL